MFNSDLDAKNDLPFLAYVDPAVYKVLIHIKGRKAGSFKRIAIYSQLDDFFVLLGKHDIYAVNYQGRPSGWATITAGWDDTRGFPIHSFRYIDFLNILIGEYRSGSSVALTDKKQNTIRNIRIDYDFKSYSGEAAIRLAREIQQKLADIGLDCFFCCTGNRGIQAIIPFPEPLPFISACAFWERIKPYIDTDLATLDKVSINSLLRLPLGIHASTNNLGLYYSPETGAYVSHIDQLNHLKNSWQWEKPIHIPNAIDQDAFLEAAEKDFSFIPDLKVVSLVVKPSQKKLPRNNDWAQEIWDQRTKLQPGQWQNYLLEQDAIRAAFVLFDNNALSKLEELAGQIPVLVASDVVDRIRRVRYLWQKFIPLLPPQNSSKTLSTMMTTSITSDTADEAGILFEYINRHKTASTRWINKNTKDYILAVLHGMHCSSTDKLTLTIDELLIYMQKALFSKMVRRTLVSIIQKSTQDPPPIRTSNNRQVIINKPLAVFQYDPGYKIFRGATPGTFSRVPGLRIKALKAINSTTMSNADE